MMEKALGLELKNKPRCLGAGFATWWPCEPG